MNLKGFSTGIIFLLAAMLCTTCTKDENLLSPDGETSFQKAAQVNYSVFEVYPSGDLSGETDVQNIKEALHLAAPGDMVQLAEGIFYLNRSVVCWDFSGTLKGAGKDETIIRTAPGVTFDVSEDPPLVWDGNWVNEGHSIFSFPHHFSKEHRTVSVSDLAIEVNDPCTEWGRDIHNENSRHNTLIPILVFHEGLDRNYAKTMNLDVYYKDLILKGIEDDSRFEGVAGTSFSIATGLGAAGASDGDVFVEDVQITNATFALSLHVFNGKNASVHVLNSKVEHARLGMYSAINHSWVVKNNEFRNIRNEGLLLESYGIRAGSSIIEENQFIMDGGWYALAGVFINNVQVLGNTITGDCYTGIWAWGRSGWEIRENDLCDLTAGNDESATILLDYNTECVIEENAGQVVGGTSAGDPSNFIGEAVACD